MMVTGMRSMTSTSGVNRMMRISFIIWITRMEDWNGSLG